jgi:hypothetical protein
MYPFDTFQVPPYVDTIVLRVVVGDINLRVQLVPSPWKSMLQLQVKPLAVGLHLAFVSQLLFPVSQNPVQTHKVKDIS